MEIQKKEQSRDGRLTRKACHALPATRGVDFVMATRMCGELCEAEAADESTATVLPKGDLSRPDIVMPNMLATRSCMT